MTDHTMPDRASLIDFDLLLASLAARGIQAQIANTGGGVMTIGVLPMTPDANGDDRYTLMLGPGSYTIDGTIHGAPGDFYIGPDDDGDEPHTHTLTVHTTTDVTALVTITGSILDRRHAGNPDLSDLTA